MAREWERGNGRARKGVQFILQTCYMQESRYRQSRRCHPPPTTPFSPPSAIRKCFCHFGRHEYAANGRERDGATQHIWAGSSRKRGSNYVDQWKRFQIIKSNWNSLKRGEKRSSILPNSINVYVMTYIMCVFPVYGICWKSCDRLFDFSAKLQTYISMLEFI